ncbi:MAG TPA: SH3 domain-containing protein [Leptospiraceae bacterium]|nr:SH3 domain-containing protein [Leptospiraceae bacterium]HMY66629.1 SH3 domain-containing protein [Leptospiraceae bacterium]HMZ62419.1 SH3 domain-containing protein [Leptospiraceae bacterium]HNF13795.1 SH3 domain-containing protein [Leptospiraceae bacterium]HNF24691.1 SH3 domain-containing protein [Leptospiraceae bacterium]
MMKKYIFYILFSVSYALSLPADEIEGEWRMVDRNGWTVTASAGSISYDFFGEGCKVHLTGTYRTEGKKVHYQFQEPDAESRKCDNLDWRGKLSGKCTVLERKDHLIFSKQLDCSGILNHVFFSGEVGLGEVRRLNGKELYMLGNQSASVNDTAFIRSGPSVKSPPLSCTLASDLSTGSKSRGTLPKGHKLKLIGRLQKMEKVQKWENYWYYVDPKDDWYTMCSKGWVFGEFITIDK